MTELSTTPQSDFELMLEDLKTYNISLNDIIRKWEIKF